MKNKLIISILCVLCFIISGCANVQMGFNFNKDGTITQQDTFELSSSFRQLDTAYDVDMQSKKNDSIKQGFEIKDTENGFIETKNYKDITEIATLKIFQPNIIGGTNGIQVHKGLLYDYYSLEVFLQGQPDDRPKIDFRETIPSYFSYGMNMNIWDYLEYRKQAEKEAQTMNQLANYAMQSSIDSMKMDFSITVPYGVDFSNADMVTNDNKTLTWNLKPAFLNNKDISIKTKFRIYHEKTIMVIAIIGIILLIGLIVLIVLSVTHWSNKEKRNVFLGISVAILLIIASAGIYIKYTIDNPPMLTKEDIITVEQSKDDNTENTININENDSNINSKNIDTEKQDDTLLKEANDILANKGVAYKVSAVSNIDDAGFLGLATGKGLVLIVYDKSTNTVATVNFDKTIFALRDNKSPNSNILNPLQFKLRIDNDNQNSKDKEAGIWSGTTHIIPIYALYEVDANNNIIPGALYTGSGENPGHYHSYLYEQQNVNLSNIVLTHADSLYADVNARKISLP